MKAEVRVLRNGLRVVLAPCEAESVAFGLFVASGSRHEPEHFAGISHLIEHMLFKGTPKRGPLAITRTVEGRGGNFNAWTSEEGTAYYTHMPYEYLDEAVDVIADMFLHASIPDDEFARERDVVLEEIKMYQDEPDSVAVENLQRALFPASRLGASVAGSEKTLRALRPEDLRRYIRSHYRSDNTVAVLVGRFDPEQAIKVVSRCLSSLHAARPRSVAAPAGFGRVVPRTEKEMEVHQLQLALGFRTFGIGDPRKYAATVFDAVMGRGMSSRLFQQVRERRGLSYDISSRMQFFSDTGLWMVTAGVDEGRHTQTVETVNREFKRIRERPVTAAELRRTKEFLIGNFRLSHEKVTSKLFFYGQTLQSFGRLVDPEEQVAGIRAVTPDDVRAVARAILRPANASVSIVRPKA